MTKKLAIIPARGGSKRIPRKNIKLFKGTPIIGLVIREVLATGVFDEIMVSTEDKEIAKTASKFGASIPFERSNKNSSDTATTSAVIEEVLAKYKKEGKEFEYACCIYPTAVLTKKQVIKKGVRMLENSNADAVIPVIRYSHPIERAFMLSSDRLCLKDPEMLNMPTQKFEPTYHDSGQFYWIRVKSFLNQKQILMDHSLGLVLDEWEAHDIDDMSGWKMAECKYEHVNKKLPK